MKSAQPKVLHPSRRSHAHRPGAQGRCPAQSRVGHDRRRPSGRRSSKPHVPAGPNVTSWSRSHSWAPPTPSCRQRRYWAIGRDAGPALGRRAAAVARHGRAARRRPTGCRRRRHRRDRDRASADGYGRIVRQDGRIARIVEERDASRRRSARSGRSTPASTPSTWRRSFPRCEASPPTTRRASTTCPISWASIGGANSSWKRSPSRTAGNPGSQQPRRAGGSERNRATAEERPN